MSDQTIKRVSLAGIRRMQEQGKLFHDPNAPEGGDDLGPDFWKTATVESPKRSKSVHLKIDPEVYDFFVEITKGKGHLTRMRNVLRAYMEAHRQR